MFYKVKLDSDKPIYFDSKQLANFGKYSCNPCLLNYRRLTRAEKEAVNYCRIHKNGLFLACSWLDGTNATGRVWLDSR